MNYLNARNSILLVLSVSLLLLLVFSFKDVSFEKSENESVNKIENNIVFFGGDIVTMKEPKNTIEHTWPEAVWVKNGQIKRVGTKENILASAGEESVQIDLEGQTLMPGFVEPHTHLPLIISFSAVTDLSPCLPERYAYQYYDDDNIECPVNLIETRDALNNSKKRELKPENEPSKNWIIANGIDPSRLGNQNLPQLKRFINNPAMWLEKEIDGGENQPIFILDQSGHIAYVNIQAYVSAGICESKNTCNKESMTVLGKSNDPAPLGTWVESEGRFTGKLLEEPAYGLFIAAISKDLGKPLDSPFFFMSKEEGYEKAPHFINEVARTGVTTMVNAGGFKESEVLFFKYLAESNLNNSKLRYRSLISTDIIGNDSGVSSREVARSLKTNIWDDANNGLYGVYGIKLWADGSTQGCSAYLNDDYADNGICQSTAGSQGANYSDVTIIEAIRSYWGDDWLVQVHANGDAAMKQTIDTFFELQSTCSLELGLKPNLYPLTLHHATVGGDPVTNENMMAIISKYRNKNIQCRARGDGRDIVFSAPLNITVSHTPAHIAYWGGAFQSLLDGKGELVEAPVTIEKDTEGRTTMIDATASDVKNSIPFSLHSDVPVSPVNPLWYVEQVVNRNTWFYPDLTDNDVQVMPINGKIGEQAVSVYQALRGITIVPAQQNLLSDKIGSIEAGKVADLVILDRNPLKVDSNSIHSINVISTFVNGVQHDWTQ